VHLTGRVPVVVSGVVTRRMVDRLVPVARPGQPAGGDWPMERALGQRGRLYRLRARRNSTTRQSILSQNHIYEIKFIKYNSDV